MEAQRETQSAMLVELPCNRMQMVKRAYRAGIERCCREAMFEEVLRGLPANLTAYKQRIEALAVVTPTSWPPSYVHVTASDRYSVSPP